MKTIELEQDAKAGFSASGGYATTPQTKKTPKPKCRCHINAKYHEGAWRTGKLPRACPVPGHDEDLKA